MVSDPDRTAGRRAADAILKEAKLNLAEPDRAHRGAQGHLTTVEPFACALLPGPVSGRRSRVRANYLALGVAALPLWASLPIP